MNRRNFLGTLALIGCSPNEYIEPKVRARNLLWSLSANTPAPSIPWYLGNNLVDPSVIYAAYDPLIASDLASSYSNLNDPGVHDVQVPVAPTLSGGWLFNGSTQYLNTGVAAKQNQTVIAWIEGPNGFITGTYAFGASQSSPTRTLFYRPKSGTNHEFQKGATKASWGPLYNGAVVAIAQTKAYANGNVEATLDGFASDGTQNIYIGCYNSNGTPSNFCACKVLRFAIYNTSLSDTQIQAVTSAMLDYQVDTLDSSYAAKVLALNPLVYYPCNETVGTVLQDHSGNKYHGEAYGCTLYGNGFKSDGTPLDSGRPNYKFIADRAADLSGSGIVWDNEFTFSCIFTPSGNASPQVRLYETSHAATVNSPLGDYVAFELRNGNNLSFYLKEDGIAFASGTITLINTDPHHITCYNSLTDGVWGITVDGVFYETAKLSAVGLTADLLIRYPYLNDESDSMMKHVALWNRRLSHAEILTLGL